MPKTRLGLVGATIFTVCEPAVAQWTVTILHPDEALGSVCVGVDEHYQVGLLSHADGSESSVVWEGTTDSMRVLDVSGATFSGVIGTRSDRGVGSASGLGGFATHAIVWDLISLWATDLHPIAATHSVAMGCWGNEQVGAVLWGDGNWRASRWLGAAGSYSDLHPFWAQWSELTATDGVRQVGRVQIGTVGKLHAAMWGGTPESCIDLHPQDEEESECVALGDGYQAGSVSSPPNYWRAALWFGSKDNWISLNPNGAIRSRLAGADGDVQVGSVDTFCGPSLASLWLGSPGSWINLNSKIPSEWQAVNVEARAVRQLPNEILVGGRAQVNGKQIALLWRFDGSLPCFADVNNDGFVNGDDFDWFAERFENGEAAADLDGDCFVNGNDYDRFAEHFEVGC